MKSCRTAFRNMFHSCLLQIIIYDPPYYDHFRKCRLLYPLLSKYLAIDLAQPNQFCGDKRNVFLQENTCRKVTMEGILFSFIPYKMDPGN